MHQEQIQKDIAHIQQWMKKLPHLDFKIDNDLVLSFLRCSKFSLERTKEKIDTHYTARTFAPEVFTNRDPFLPEMQDLLNVGVMLPLPLVDSTGRRIIWYSCNQSLNPDTMSIQDVGKLAYMMMDILLMEDNYVTMNGVTNVINCKDAHPKYVLQLTPPFVKKHIDITEKGYPFRINGFHIINIPSIFKYIYDLAKSFFSKKMSERITMYNERNFSEIYKVIPQNLLPKEYGGENGSLKDLTITWKRKVESYRDWFLEDEKLKSNENLRQRPLKIFSYELFTEGSFRQLNID